MSIIVIIILYLCTNYITLLRKASVFLFWSNPLEHSYNMVAKALSTKLKRYTAEQLRVLKVKTAFIFLVIIRIQLAR